MRDIVVVGAGQAGAQTALSLREFGFDGSITLVGAEAHQPYQRPPLSKAFLNGEASESSCELRSPELYRDQSINVVTGDRVVAARADGALLEMASGRTLPFDGLALATGVRPRRLGIAGANGPGVHYLRTLDDAVALRDALAAASQRGQAVAVIGAGFIGLEIAASCRMRGLDVTIIETSERVLSRGVGPQMAGFLHEAHVRNGVTMLLDTSATEIVRDDVGAICGLRTSQGAVVPCAHVVVGIGSLPRMELAQQLGLACTTGVVIDDGCRTSDPHIVAAGDCTVFRPRWARGEVRLESVPNATDQGRIAAATLLDIDHPVQGSPWFWSDQGHLKVQIAGWTHGSDHQVVRQGSEADSVSVVHFAGGRLAGVEALNKPHDFSAVKRALAKGATISAAQAADPCVPLKSIVRE